MRDNQRSKIYAAEREFFKRAKPEKEKNGIRKLFNQLRKTPGLQNVEMKYRKGGDRSLYRPSRYSDTGELITPGLIKLYSPIRWMMLHEFAHHVVWERYRHWDNHEEWLQDHGFEFACASTALYITHLGIDREEFDYPSMFRVYAKHGVLFFRDGKR